MKKRKRVSLLIVALSVVAFGFFQESEAGWFGKKKLVFKNADFYVDGKFDVEKGKDAIVTEVANVHTGSCVRHSDKAVNENFMGK